MVCLQSEHYVRVNTQKTGNTSERTQSHTTIGPKTSNPCIKKTEMWFKASSWPIAEFCNSRNTVPRLLIPYLAIAFSTGAAAGGAAGTGAGAGGGTKFSALRGEARAFLGHRTNKQPSGNRKVVYIYIYIYKKYTLIDTIYICLSLSIYIYI